MGGVGVCILLLLFLEMGPFFVRHHILWDLMVVLLWEQSNARSLLCFPPITATTDAAFNFTHG